MHVHLSVVVMLLVAWSAAGAFELDERPAEPGRWGFRPEDGAEVHRNPPGFTWRPTDGAVSYTLEIGADEAFGEVKYRQRDTPWSADCPRQTLAPGTYFWRYRAANEAGERTGWSRVRAFTVPADAVEFPRPRLEPAAEHVPQEHPRIFFREEDIPAMRRASREGLRESWKEIKKKADRTLENPPDTSEPPKYPPDVERKSDRWRKIWWGNRRRVIAVADGAANLGFVYRLTGEEKYARAARGLLLALCEWDPEGSTAYDYNDEAAMPALYFTSRAYDWAYPVLSAEDRHRIIRTMRVRGRQAFESLRRRRHLWRPYSSHHNRAWHFLGEVALAFHGDIPEAERWLDYAMTVFYTAYPVWCDADGGWHEGVLYWASYMRRFMYWAVVMRTAFDVDVFDRPFFGRTGYYGMYVLPPGTQHAGFADMAPRAKASRLRNLMALLAMGARNPHWLWYARQAGYREPRDYSGFVFAYRAEDLEPQPPEDLPSSSCFHGVGLAALNTDLTDGTSNVQLLFKSSPLGSISHGFNANNTFHLNVRGKPVLMNTGRRDQHGTPHHRKWMWQTKSQNAILVNGEGQRPHSPNARGRITRFETGPQMDLLAGEAGDSYGNLDRWTRRIVFLKPHFFVIHDVLEAPSPSTYQWLVHAPGRFRVEGQTLTYQEEDRGVAVHLLEPERLSVSQTDRYEPPPAEWASFKLHAWHATAATRRESRRAEFVTVIRVDNEPASWELGGEVGGRVLTLRSGEAGAEITLGWDEFDVRAEGFGAAGR
ncbi:MAG: DUF4962 domain-containing protein [Candidatus Brocadiia bacterium]